MSASSEAQPLKNETITHASIFSLGLVVITLLAAAVRMGPSFQSDFPLNDGGMFYVMIQDLQRCHFALPALTTYNADAIPFLYPPFGLYFAGLLQSLTGWDLLDILRVLPGVVSTLTVPAFYLFSGVFFERSEKRLVATLAFAFFPQAFQWLIAGGGVTRSFGMLFSLLALTYNIQLLRAGARKHLILGALLTGLTVLSHPEAAWFMTFSTVFFFVQRPSKRAFISLMSLFLVSLLPILPWAVFIISRFNYGFLLPVASGNLLPFADLMILVSFITLGTDPFPSFLFVFAFIGAIVCLINRKPLIPVWVVLIFLVQRRAADHRAVIAFALLAATAVMDVFVPLFTRILDHTHRLRLAVVVTGYLLLYLPITALFSSNAFTGTLPETSRAAMAWARENTAAESRFLVFPEDIWIKDRTAEWFPALAGRQSVTTVQGHEWLPGFAERGERHFDLLDCAGQGLTCLDAWAQKHAIGYEYIFFSGPAKTYLQGAVEGDPAYRLVYENPAAAIYQKQAQTGVD